MKVRDLFAVLFLVAVAAEYTGCASSPSVRDRYENLDYDSKTVFLTYYPYLSPIQREDFLSDPTVDPKTLIEGWKNDLNDPGHEVSSFTEMMRNPLNRKITDLEIQTGSPQGTRIPLHAFAVYARQGKRVEVTADADWRVGTQLAHVARHGNGEALEFGCMSSDVKVGADFLGERDGSRTIAIHKPLERLDLEVSEAYIGIDSGYNFKLVLLARCKDGTVSDVSCEATWRSASDEGRIEGCGNFVISSKENLAREEALTVTASYGNLSLRKTLHPPVR